MLTVCLGLFHRAILMSGCSLNSWAFIGDCVARSFRLGDKLGKKTNDAQELLSFLQGVPALDLVKFQGKVVTAQVSFLSLSALTSKLIFRF